MSLIKRRIVLSLIFPPVILVLLSLAYPFLESLITGFPGISCGLFDLIRVHILLMWLGWGVLLYLSLIAYDVCKYFITNELDISNHPVLQNSVKAIQKYHPVFIRLIFAVIIPLYLFLAGGIITKSMYFFYDVNNGVFLASDIVLMFRQYPEVSYLLMILVLYGVIWVYDKK